MEKDEYKIMHHIEQSYWWFTGKRFLVNSILKKFSLDRCQDSLLDIGCGTGIILKLLQSFGTAYGTEISSEAIRFLRQRDLKLVARSNAMECLPFRSNTFSAITCLDMLEHLESCSPVIKEMFRVCKPGGHVIITVPAFEILWSNHDVALHHKRRYTKYQMLRLIRQMNWEVIKSSYFNTSLFLPILLVRKLKPLLHTKDEVHSDFFMPIPRWINAALTLLFVSEASCLRFLNFPFGVSLLLIIQKPGGDRFEV